MKVCKQANASQYIDQLGADFCSSHIFVKLCSGITKPNVIQKDIGPPMANQLLENKVFAFSHCTLFVSTLPLFLLIIHFLVSGKSLCRC